MKSTGLIWMALGCVSALIAVAMGAFGAHGLATKVSENMLDVFKTGAQYQMYHSLALIAFSLWIRQQTILSGEISTISTLPALFFVSGILLFSGSLYGLVLTDTKWLGAITPLGGLSFMMGWGFWAWQIFKLS